MTPFVLASPASALSVGDTVCYEADGTAVVNPPNPEDFEYCMTREPSTSGGGNTPQVCTITVYTSIAGDGSTIQRTVTRCSPVRPLQG